MYILFKDCQYGLVFVFLSEHNILCRWKNYLQQVIINLRKIKSRLVYAGKWEKQRTKKAKLLNRIKNCGIIWIRPVMVGLPYAESKMNLIILQTNLASQNWTRLEHCTVGKVESNHGMNFFLCKNLSGSLCKDTNSPYWLTHVYVMLIRRIYLVIDCYSLVKIYCVKTALLIELHNMPLLTEKCNTL